MEKLVFVAKELKEEGFAESIKANFMKARKFLEKNKTVSGVIILTGEGTSEYAQELAKTVQERDFPDTKFKVVDELRNVHVYAFLS